ncbi:MAG: hypothetical protein HGA45_29200 [Chloroflexales bacterium]|nr:hypothetical protein [Chloroflexales bacterium]
MAANETALILVQPDDSIDAVLEKVRGSGAQSVQILVPDGAIGLRTVAQANRLRQLAEGSRLDLSLVSSDPAIIGAAWISQIQIIVVCNTQVVAADPPSPRAATPATHRDGPDDPGDEPARARTPDPQRAPSHARPQTAPAPKQRADHRPLRSGELPRRAAPRPKGHAPSRPRQRRGDGPAR